MQHTQQQKKRSESPKRPPRVRSGPDRGSPPRSDGDNAGAEVCYSDLFSTPALDEANTEGEDTGPADVWGDPEAEPPTIPNLRFTAYPPERILYAAAFRAAYKYPDSLMLVMNGVRKGLERGQKAAERRGDNR